MKEEHLQVKRHHGPTLSEQIKWHLGTIAAILCLVVLGLQIFRVIGGPPASAYAVADDLDGTIERVRGSVAGRAFPTDERLKAIDDQIGVLRTSLKHHSAPAEAGEGLTYPPSYLKLLQPGESNEIRFQAPVSLTATPEAGGIDLKWADPPNNNVKVGTFEIFRKEGSGEPAKIQAVEGTAHQFRDASVKAGHSYEYTVQAVAADADLSNTPRGRSPFSAPATAKALTDFKLELVDHQGDVATIKVAKWHGGGWRDRTFEVKEGETIGKMDQALGIDFSTGRKLAKLTVETSEEQVSRDELVFDARGKVVVEGGAPKRVSVSRQETRRKTIASIAGGELPDDTLELQKD
jgi:hypothetical protein